MINWIWGLMILVGIITAFVQALFVPDFSLNDVLQSLFKSASTATEIVIGLAGMMCFWLGLARIMEVTKVTDLLAKILYPLFRVIMPDIPKGHPAIGNVTMNLSANMLGLDNAATPLGIRAMKDLESINPNKGVASNSQIMFLVLNTSSVTLFPISVFLYRSKFGAISPTDVFLPILLATTCSTVAGFLFVAVAQKINLLKTPLLLAFGLLLALLTSTAIWAYLAGANLVSQATSLSNGVILLLIGLVVVFGLYKKCDVFQEFINGSKEGFKICIDILPYLVSMLGAIALLKASGFLGYIVSGLKIFVNHFGVNADFIDALPVSLMHSLSGGGSRAMMLEIFQEYGVDSFQGFLASVMQGSTETTFYVIAVYFGAVGITRFRYAVFAGLFSDFAAMVASVFIAYLFYSGAI